MGEETTRLREEIDATRADLTRDVDLITDRASPSRIARRRWEGARRSATAVRERVMGSESSAFDMATSRIGDAADSVQGGTQAVVERTRQSTEGSPLAAGLLAFGIGWLAASLLPASEAERKAAEGAGGALREHAGPFVEQAKGSAQEIGQHLQEETKRHAGDLREHAQQAAATMAQEGRGAARDIADQARP